MSRDGKTGVWEWLVSQAWQEIHQPHPAKHTERCEFRGPGDRHLLSTWLFQTTRPCVHFQKKKIIKTKKPWSTCHLRVAGSDGVNPGDLRGGGEA
jgi:hypothetical protein